MDWWQLLIFEASAYVLFIKLLWVRRTF